MQTTMDRLCLHTLLSHCHPPLSPLFAPFQAADAALSKEQLEEREAARLAALEAARLKRMKADATADAAAAGGDDEGEADGDTAADLPKGGYAAKRARAKFEAEREDKRQKRRLDASGVLGGGGRGKHLV